VRQLLLKHSAVPFIVVIGILLFSSCEKKFDSVLDPVQNSPTAIDAAFSLNVINTDTINVGNVRQSDDMLSIRGTATVRVFHLQGEKEISAVKYSIMDLSSSTLGEGNLHDDGVPPDRTANDSIYSGYAQFQIQRVFVGKLKLSIWSENNAGQLSNTALLPISIIRLNHPPVISDLIAPSTINLATTNSFEISLKVIDSDGQNDIKSVSRYTPSGKVLPLFSSNDSIYVETVTLVPAPDPGSYLFRFRAVDRSNDSSNVLTKTIVITNEATAN
jgi:hypothetical protein